MDAMTSLLLTQEPRPTTRTGPGVQVVSLMISDEQFATWCRRLRASDRTAYEEVFRAMHDPMLRYVVSLIRSKATARDIVHDAFVKLWTVRHTLDPDRSLKAFLYRMVRNLAFNNRRNRITRDAKIDLVRDTISEPFARPDESLDAHHLKIQLRAWMDELPPRQREALELSRFEGLSHEEIATVMQVSPRTVNNHVVKAMKHLRHRILAYEPELLAL